MKSLLTPEILAVRMHPPADPAKLSLASLMPLIADTHIRVADAETGELLCELPLEPSRKGAECPGRLVPTDVQHPGPT